MPEDWVEDVRRADEDTIFDVIKHLPQEAQEALLKLAVGERLGAADARAGRRRPLRPSRRAAPLPRRCTTSRSWGARSTPPGTSWAVFLHPAQRAFVERDHDGPARVAGSAGTGKTVVALHRAVRLLRADPQARVLLTTFTPRLAEALRRKVDVLAGTEPAILSPPHRKAPATPSPRISTPSGTGPAPPRAAKPCCATLLAEAASQGESFAQRFLLGEWTHVVDAWQLAVLRRPMPRRAAARPQEPARRQAARAPRRDLLAARASLRRQHARDGGGRVRPPSPPTRGRRADALRRLWWSTRRRTSACPRLRFLAAMAATGRTRCSSPATSASASSSSRSPGRASGIDLRGRSATLQVNYRTSHQIRQQADRLLPRGRVATSTAPRRSRARARSRCSTARSRPCAPSPDVAAERAAWPAGCGRRCRAACRRTRSP